MTESNDNPAHSGYLKRLMQGMVLSAVNFFVVIALSFWLAPIQIHTLGERLNGIWQTVAALTGWFALMDFGLNYTVSRFVTKSFSTRDYDECNQYASTGLGLFLTFGSVVFVLSLLFGFGASRCFPKVEDIGLIGTVLFLSGAAFALDFPLRAFAGISIGTMRHDLVGLATIASRITGAVITYMILVSGGRLIALAAGNIAFMLVQIAAFYMIARRSFPQLNLSRKNLRRTHVRSLFNYSVFGFIAQIGNMFIFQVSNLMIPIMFAFEYVTSFNIAITFADQFRSLLFTITNWMVTWMTYLHTQGLKDELLKTMRFGFKFCTFISGFIAFGLIFWCEPFITRWILTPEAIESGKINPLFWRDIVPCVVVMTLAAAVRSSLEPNGRYLFATAKHHYYAFSNIIEGLLSIELYFIFASQWGLVGFAWGTLITSVIMRGIFLPLIVCRLMERNFFAYYCEMLWLFLLVGVSLIVPAIVTRLLVAPNYPSLFLVGGISAVTYFPTICLIGFTAEERRKINGYFFSSFRK